MVYSRRFYFAIFFAFCLLVSKASQAQQLLRGPYLQVGTPNSIVIRWRTDASTQSRVEFGPAPNELTSAVTNSAPTTEHEVSLTELNPNTKYFYSIGTQSTTLAGGDSSHFFVTSPPPGTVQPTRIWILGDSGTKTGNARRVRDAYYNFTGDIHTDFWLMLGDNAYESGTDEEYQEAVFENMYEEMLIKSVLWPTLGNHDDDTDSSPGPYPYYEIFTLPKNGEAGGLASGTEEYYSFDYGNIHFICLNSTEGSLRDENSAMWIWLEEDLAANDKGWTIAYWHHPPYSKGSHDSDTENDLIEMRERAVPILESGGIDLVLTGHSHSYERSYLIDGHYDVSQTLADSMILDDGDGRLDGDGAYTKPSSGNAPREGAIYVVNGSSGKVDGGSFDHPVMSIFLETLGSMVLDIDGNQLDAKFIASDGVVRDYFTLVKGDAQISAAEILKISGDEQIGVVGDTLPEPLVVEVRDAQGTPVQDFPVTFSTFLSDSLVGKDTLSTDIIGQAAYTLILGPNPGPINVTATAEGLAGSPIQFSADAALQASPTIDVHPPSHDFGEIVLGDSVSNAFVVTNKGAEDLLVSNIALAGADSLDFDLDNGVAPFTLVHGDSQEVEVQFKPNSEGLKEARLRFESNDSSATTLDVVLNGTGRIPVPEIVVSPKISTNPTPINADDPAIWIHPTDPSRSVVIGTDGTAGVYVWDMNGNQLQNIPQGTDVNNVDVRQNVSLGGQTVDIVAANLRDAGKLAVFKVNPNYSGPDVLIQIANVNSFNNDIQNDSYGFCLYKRPSDNALFVFERPKNNGQLRQYQVQSDSAVTEITVTPVRDLEYSGETAEGFVADDELGFLYITEEEVGIHKYFADPNMGNQPLALFATTDGIEPDREGLALYACENGAGYLVLSSQGNSTIKIYERQNDNQFVKNVIPLNDQGGTGLATDGLDVTPFAAPPNFPNGFLVVHDQDARRFQLYDWAQIAENDLTVCVDGTIPQPQPKIAVAPSSLDFGEVFIDSSATHHFNIINSGEAVLSVTSLTLNGEHPAEFSIETSTDTLTIAPSDTHQVTVGFQPTSEGEKHATLLIENNAPDGISITVNMMGRGVVPVPVATVTPIVSTTSTPGDADDPAIWIHPTDPGRSVIIATDKTAGIYVWDMNGNELQNIPQGTTLNNVDVRQNVALGGQVVDIVAANLRDAGKLAVFKVNPNYSGPDVLIQIANINSANNDIQDDSYGLCLYKRPPDNALFVFERPKNGGQLRQYHIQSDSAVTEITVTPVRDLEYNSDTVEGFVADDELGFVYITEEEVGIHKYFADPNMDTQRLALFATGDGIEPDREGLALYPCENGGGYLVLASQGNSTIKIYERQNDNRFVKNVIPLDDQGQIGLGTDGLDVTPFAAPPNFPNGFVVVHDQDAKRFHVYDWAQFAEDDLTTCVDGVIQQPSPKIAAAPSSLDFGDVFIDSSATQNFNVINIGDAGLVVTDLTLNGEHQTEFSIESSADTLTIAPGDTQQVTVGFHPISEGEKQATLSIENNDPDAGSLTVTLTGSGKANVPVSVDSDPETQLPKQIALKPNYPNPFNIETTIQYELPERSKVRLVIYNLLGRPIRTLIDETESPGVKRVRWNGKNRQGQEVGSGIYYVELTANGKSLLRKITLLK